MLSPAWSVRSLVTRERAVSHQGAGGKSDHADESIPRHRQPKQTIAAGVADEDPDRREFPYGAPPDGDPRATVVDHADVAGLVLRTVGHRGVISVDHVTIEVEGDPTRADDDAVVGAV